MNGEILVYLVPGIVALAVLVGVWFMVRQVVLWYFRLDRIVELLEVIAGEGGAPTERDE